MSVRIAEIKKLIGSNIEFEGLHKKLKNFIDSLTQENLFLRIEIDRLGKEIDRLKNC